MAEWLDKRGIRASPVITAIPVSDWVLLSIRVDWDDPADEVWHTTALRRWVEDMEASDDVTQFDRNPAEYSLWTMSWVDSPEWRGVDYSDRSGIGVPPGI
jgi:hypothetical protein